MTAKEISPGLIVQRFTPPLALADFKLIAFDMDSTLINIECIDEIADAVGKKAEVAAITEATMRGEIKDFKESLRRRVALLKGVPVDALQEVYDERLRLLAQCLDASGGRPRLEDLLAAFLRPAFSLGLDSGVDGATFGKLRARLSVESEDLYRRILSRAFDASTRRFLAAVTAALPDLPTTEVAWRFHFMLGTMIYTMANSGRIQSVNMGGGVDQATLRGLRAEQLPFGVIVDGGAERDSLALDNVISFDPTRFLSWETIDLTGGSSLDFMGGDRTLRLGDSGTGTGVVTLETTSTFVAADGMSFVRPFAAGQSATVRNAGLIDMAGGSNQPNDRFTVSGDYVGVGGTLRINTFLGDDSSPSDQLAIDQGAASGTTGEPSRRA